MTGWCDEAWVTVAVDDGQALNALILARSLRWTMTNRKMLVILGQAVSTLMRKRLEHEFDACIKIYDAPNRLNAETFGKIFCWSLTLLKKVVYVNSNLVTVRNFDNIFGTTQFGILFRANESGMKETLLATFSPSLDVFEKIMERISAGKGNGLSLDSIFEDWFLVHNAEMISQKFVTGLDFSGKVKTSKKRNNLNAAFFHFKTNPQFEHEGKQSNHLNDFELNMLEFWKLLYVQVNPSNPTDYMIGANPEHYNNEPIAIVGMACRLPSANNLEEFWNLLINKQEAIVPVPDFRWTADQHYSEITEENRKIEAGFLKCPIDEFDGRFFGMSPMELSFTDPQQRLQLEVAWEALEDAGISASSLKNSRTGIFTGTWLSDYKDSLVQIGATRKEFYRSYMGNGIGASAGRLSHFFGTIGSNIATESGCSSSIVAVGLAVKSLRSGDSEIALACGVNLLCHPFSHKDLISIVSPDGRCKTFDEAADGFGRAEGCGVLVLKRLSNAVRDNDRIYATIRGYGEVQEGPSTSMGTPTIQCESLAMRLALKDANIAPNQVSFVECHGTGTPVGDPLEMEAIAQVYSEGRLQPLIVASVKSNIGHTESCSGITGIIKTVLSLNHELIPAHIGCKNLNPRIDLEKTPAQIPFEPIAWKREASKKRYTGISSFGITGTDAHIILEEAPILPTLKKMKKDLPKNIVTFSAKTEEALDQLLEDYRAYLGQNEFVLSDVAFTANTGREKLVPFRAAIVGSNCAEIVRKIEKKSYIKQECQQSERPKLCFLFTGQGSQYNGMAKMLYDHFPVFKKHLDHCFSGLEKYDVDIRDVIWSEKPDERINHSFYSQTSIFCVEYALFKLWTSWGIRPDMVAGNSLGEFGAATAAGILSIDDALKVIALRTLMLESLQKGRMIAVRSDSKTTETMLKQIASHKSDFWLDVACINSPRQIVLAGSGENIQLFEEMCKNNGVSTSIIQTDMAYHSRHMKPMIEEYRKLLESIKYSQPTCDYISGNTGKLLKTGMNADYWVNHLEDCVRFSDASKALYENGARFCLEISPHPILSSLFVSNIEEQIKNPDPINCIPSLRRGEDDVATILNALGSVFCNGFDINWKHFHKTVKGEKIPLPFYPFTRKRHWFEIPRIGNEANGKELHPLIGVALPNATNNKIFQSFIHGSTQSWMLDHVIGKYVIFPGAGYIEMFLAAGYASTLASFEDFSSVPTTPISVENVGILSPLEISSDTATALQTIIVNEEEGFKTGSIYQRREEKWISHANGKITFAINQKFSNDNLRLDEIKNSWSLGPDPVQFYNQLSTYGLKFGETFKSLKKIWKNEKENNGSIVAEILIPSESSQFLIHPVAIDAMIQSLIIAKTETVSKLCVPVSIQNFTWFAKPDSTTCYIKVEHDTSVLYGENCQRLAEMSGVQIIETDLETISRAVDSNKISLPQMFEDIWKPDPSSVIYNPKPRFQTDFLKNDVKLELEKLLSGRNFNDRVNSAFHRTNEIVTLFTMQGFHQLGWHFKLGDVVEIKEFMKNTNIIPKYLLLVRRLFEILKEDGYMEEVSEYEFKLVQNFPSLSEISKRLNEEEKLNSSNKFIEADLVFACMSKLTPILLGTETALPILFPEDDAAVSADQFYKRSETTETTSQLLSDAISYVISNRFQVTGESSNCPPLQILEIGAGTGSATCVALPLLEASGINYIYTFTDLSTMFFIKANKRFAQYSKHLQYKILNIENDPMSQGFSPYQYDLAIASNVLHATQDLAETVRNARVLLKPRGMFVILESFLPMRYTDASFGLLDGYWRFTDYDLRPHHTLIDHQKWKLVLEKSGFASTITANLSHDTSGLVIGETCNSIVKYKSPKLNERKCWIVLGSPSALRDKLEEQLESLDRKVCKMEYTNKFQKLTDLYYTARASELEDCQLVFNQLNSAEIEGIIYLYGMEAEKGQELVAQGYLNLMKTTTAQRWASGPPKLIVATEGVTYIDNIDQESTLPTSATLWGITKSLKTEFQYNAKTMDLSIGDSANDKVQQIISELWKDDPEPMISVRNGTRHIPRLSYAKFAQVPLNLPNSDRFSLVHHPTSKTIADLKFGVASKLSVPSNGIEVRVVASGLNFKDVLNVIKPDAQFENSNSVGADFCGVVTSVGDQVKRWKVGDSVLGCNFDGGALPSHITTPENGVVGLPQNMTYAEGATLPAVFSTAYHCLITIGKLQRNETVLIHAASGGVGICAIQIAQQLGATIIATAGSHKKRQFLKTKLGLQHVFNSRTLQFGQEIQRVTKGQGVQLVLNSLTSPGFKETSLAACSGKGSRFIEIGKLNIWTPSEVSELRPDVRYEIVDLTAVSQKTWENLFTQLDNWLKEGKIKPIPLTSFDAVYIRDALYFLQKAKHIGKVVCQLPNENKVWPLFNSRSTYLITGGLGGIGIEVAKWMISLGAKNLILMGRSPPKEQVLEVISHLNSSGANVQSVQGDVSSLEDCKKVLEKIKTSSNFPPLRGIMHAAGVLSDDLISNQNWSKYESVFNPKVKGAWNLHQLTLDEPLEFFVMYSSFCASFGFIGQSNHAAANCYLDSLAAYRRNSLGLPALTINWGQWGQIGVAKDLDFPGVSPFTPTQAFNALELSMKHHKLQVTVLEADMSQLKQFFSWTKSYFSEIKQIQNGKGDVKKMEISTQKFWEDYDSGNNEGKKLIVQSVVANTVSFILQLGSDDKLDVSQSFQTIGMDSLMLVELKNLLQSTFGPRVSLKVSDLTDCNSIALLSNRLIDIIEGKDVTQEEEFDQIVESDSTLPSHIKAVEGSRIMKPEEISSVLLLGCTGNLGSHVLELLCKNSQISKITVIIRSNSDEAGRTKLEQNLKDRDLNFDMGKVSFLSGDLCKERFGLQESSYNDLCEGIDAVFNCAVKANHLEQYRKSDGVNIRSVNVLGTKHVLEFASTNKTKWVYHASTLLYITNPEEEICPESWPLKSESIEVKKTAGYPLSKFIADILVGQAVENGIPCKVFRFPYLAGDSRTGNVPVKENHVFCRYISYLKLGLMPTLPMPLLLLPVDKCAELSLKIFFSEEASLGVYNVTNPHHQFENEIIEMAAELGYKVQLGSFEEFSQRMDADGETSPLYHVKEIYLDKDNVGKIIAGSSSFQSYLDNPEQFFISRKLAKLFPNIEELIEQPLETLKRDLKYAKSKGLLSQFGM